MSARSASNPTKGKAGAQNQLTLDGAAPSVSRTLSQPLASVTQIASGLKLSLELEIRGSEQWINASLEDELNLTEVKVRCPILCTTLDRRYHLQESVVVGMRRLMHAAFEKELISDSPGELMTVWTSPLGSAARTDSSSEESTQSLTDMELR